MYSRSSATAVLLLSTLFQSGLSFQRQANPSFVTSSRFSATLPSVTALKASEGGQVEKAAAEYEEPKLTEAGLPELKGDFDWDAKFAGDDDWITEDVPGKITLDDVTLAKQVTALDKLETGWRKQRLQKEYDAGKKIGFVEGAEKLNGRFAMFFLVTGLLTEYWTGITIPGQVEEMLRVGGFINVDS